MLINKSGIRLIEFKATIFKQKPFYPPTKIKNSLFDNDPQTDTKPSSSDRREHNSVMQHRSGDSNDRQHHQRDLSVPRQRQLAKLNLELKEHHFASGQLNLRCFVKYSVVYETWNEIQLGSQSIKDPVPARGELDFTHFEICSCMERRFVGYIL